MFSLTTTYDPFQIKEEQNYDYYFDSILLDEVILKLSELLPFCFNNDKKWEIAYKMIGMLKHIESSKERLFILITWLKFDFIFKKYTIYEADISIERTKETDAPAEPTFDYNSELENIKSWFKITDFESYTKFKHTDTLLSSVFNFWERNFKLIELQGFPRFDSKFEEKLYKDLIIEIVRGENNDLFRITKEPHGLKKRKHY